MSWSRSLRAHLVSVYLGARFLSLRRWLSRNLRIASREVTFFHQLDDPHSHLLLQLLPRLSGVLPVRVCIVPPPGPAYTPDPARLSGWSWADGRLLAERHGLSLPGDGPPAVERLVLAQAKAIAAGSDLSALADIGDALLSGRDDGRPEAEGVDVSAHLQRGHAMRERMGHYLSGVLHFGGEWYWGIDRLSLLIERLEGEGLDVSGVLPEPRPLAPLAVPPGTPLEFFFSFRSPYSYLAIQRILDLTRRTGVPLIIRPVLPMVMRGLSVPGVKVRTIARDASRLARQQGQPFGLICDPVGPGIRSCLALFACAQSVGAEAELIASAGRGIWAEGLDITVSADLARIATRAGLDWQEARTWLTRSDGEVLAEENRQALLAAGLWGVPSFRYGALTVWGQDRLDILEQRIG